MVGWGGGGVENFDKKKGTENLDNEEDRKLGYGRGGQKTWIRKRGAE